MIFELGLYFRYTAENSLDFGAPKTTDHPELRQPLALEVWHSIAKAVEPGQKITILTNGPLTNLATILSEKNSSSLIQVSFLFALTAAVCFFFFFIIINFISPEKNKKID